MMTFAPASSAPRRAATKLSLADALSSARETRALIVGSGVLGDAGGGFREQFPGSRAVIVADETTRSLIGGRVAAALAGAHVDCVAPFIYTDRRSTRSFVLWRSWRWRYGSTTRFRSRWDRARSTTSSNSWRIGPGARAICVWRRRPRWTATRRSGRPSLTKVRSRLSIVPRRAPWWRTST